jgi:hypothetical protein
LKKVVYDLDVVLDVLLRRVPHFSASAAALDFVGRGAVEGYLAGHAIATLFYLLRRSMGAARAKELTADLLSRVHVAPVTDAGVRRALVSQFRDFEDAISHAAAEEIDASVIVTRNVKDFKPGTIPAVLPEVFFQTEASRS